MINFIKGFFQESAAESSTRLVLIMSAANANLMCLLCLYIYQQTGKDYSSQTALLAGILLGIAATNKAVQKNKEN
jgi:uncharacterized membrane-anchored protein